MIKSFKHKGLQRYFESDDARGIRGDLRNRCRRVLSVLNQVHSVQEADIPGFRLHPLTGNLEGFWSLRVTGNWRIVFRFEDGDIYDVDLVDYHE